MRCTPFKKRSACETSKTYPLRFYCKRMKSEFGVTKTGVKFMCTSNVGTGGIRFSDTNAALYAHHGCTRRRGSSPTKRRPAPPPSRPDPHHLARPTHRPCTYPGGGAALAAVPGGQERVAVAADGGRGSGQLRTGAQFRLPGPLPRRGAAAVAVVPGGQKRAATFLRRRCTCARGRFRALLHGGCLRHPGRAIGWTNPRR